MPKPLDKHILATYFTLRMGAAVIAVAFPLLLWLGGLFYAGLPMQNSMSAYYHASADGKSMRDWFVGILFAIGVLLYLYKGFSNTENYALNVAGISAVCIALFPMEWNCGDGCGKFSIHGVFAVLFFICIAFVSVFCAPDTLRLMQDAKARDRFRRLYKTLGAVMVGSPVIAYVISEIFHQRGTLVFYVEAAGIFAFSAYWFTKSRELSITQAEKKALSGEFKK